MGGRRLRIRSRRRGGNRGDGSCWTAVIAAFAMEHSRALFSWPLRVKVVCQRSRDRARCGQTPLRPVRHPCACRVLMAHGAVHACTALAISDVATPDALPAHITEPILVVGHIISNSCPSEIARMIVAEFPIGDVTETRWGSQILSAFLKVAHEGFGFFARRSGEP